MIFLKKPNETDGFSKRKKINKEKNCNKILILNEFTYNCKISRIAKIVE